MYLAKPGTDHEKKGLVAFAKTKVLAPGEEDVLTLTFDMAKQGSFDEVQSAFVLEQGEYGLLLGTDALHTDAAGILTLDKSVILEKTNHILPKKAEFSDFSPTAEAASYDAQLPRHTLDPNAFHTNIHDYSIPETKETPKEKRILDALSEKELIELCVGGGYSTKGFIIVPGVVGTTSVRLLKKGIPNITVSDGSAGHAGRRGAEKRSGALPGGTSPRVAVGLPQICGTHRQVQTGTVGLPVHERIPLRNRPGPELGHRIDRGDRKGHRPGNAGDRCDSMAGTRHESAPQSSVWQKL